MFLTHRLSKVEDVTHTTSSCPFIWVRYYLPMRHGMVTKTFLKKSTEKITKKLNQQEKSVSQNIFKKLRIMNTGGIMALKFPHSRPDLVIWNTKDKMCSIVRFSCPADTNITKKKEKKLWTLCTKSSNNVPKLHSENKQKFFEICIVCFQKKNL